MSDHEGDRVSEDATDQLSMFQSSPVITNRLHVGGNVKEPTLQPLEEYHHGQRIVLLCVFRVDYIGFDEDKLGLVRDQKVKVAEAYDPARLIEAVADGVEAPPADVSEMIRVLRRQNEELIEKRAAAVLSEEVAEWLRDLPSPGDEE